jgi:hypothetical protein
MIPGMSIAWNTVQTAAATALLVIEYAVKPQLEARKDRHLEALRAQRRFESILIDLAVAAGVYVTDDTSTDGDAVVRKKLQAERARQYDRMQLLVTELFDNLGKFAGSYPLAPWRDDMLLVGTTMHGVLMSARSRHRQAELIVELTGISGRIFCQRQLWKAADLSKARTELRELVAQNQQRGARSAGCPHRRRPPHPHPADATVGSRHPGRPLPAARRCDGQVRKHSLRHKPIQRDRVRGTGRRPYPRGQRHQPGADTVRSWTLSRAGGMGNATARNAATSGSAPTVRVGPCGPATERPTR